MKLLNRIHTGRHAIVLAPMIILLGAFAPFLAPAAIPSGAYQVQISDPTNRVWDASRITPLQAPDFEFEDGTSIFFSAPFTQNGAGKLLGSGSTEINVTSDILTGTVPGQYVSKGTITGAKGITRITFNSTAKGTAEIEGRPRAIATSSGVKVTLDSLTQTPSGTYSSSASAAGYGSLKETGDLDLIWGEVIEMLGGDGSWVLHLSLTNDTVKKVGGTATVDISGGRTLAFSVKGNYNAKTDITILVLTADTESKGSSLKVGMIGSVAVLQGKLTGQNVKAVGALEPD